MKGVGACAVVVGLVLSASAALVGPDGRPYVKIVVDAKAPNSVRLAARELKDLLKKLGTADLPIATGADEGEAVIRLGGDPKAAKLPSDGFVIRTSPGRLVIFGKDGAGPVPEFEGRNPFRWIELYNSELKLTALQDQGTLCGVYAFLEDCCGVRFYMPGEDGTVLPKAETLKLPEIDVTRAPRFNYRYAWFCNFSKDKDCPLWFHRAGFGGQAPAVIIDSYYMAGSFQKEHPEFFALVDGERDFTNKCAVRGGGHLCLNAPGLVEAWATKIRKFFDTHPDMEIYPVTPGDGLTRVCGCKACQAELRPEMGKTGRFSYHIWKFVNAMAREVAKTHPDRFIGCLAYESYWLPPDGVDFAPNTAVMICQARNQMANAAERETFWKGVDAWSKKAGRVYFWNWYLTNWPPTDHLPVFYPKTIAADIRRMAANTKCFGEFIEAENFGKMFPFGGDRMGTPGMTHLNLYLTAKLYWNPHLDVIAALDEYYRLFYGPAEREMRAFWEESATAVESALAANAKAAPDVIFPRKVLLSLGAHLDAAAKAVPSGSVYARRLDVIDKEFRRGTGRLTRMQTAGTPVLTARPLAKASDIDTFKPLRFLGADADYGEPPTWVYGGYDRRSLTFKFLCYEPEMDKAQARVTQHDDGKMWEDDCLEIFVCPNPEDMNHGFQLIVNLAGAVMDGEWKNHAVLDRKWESGAAVTVTREPNRWVAEVSIPFASLGVADVTFAGDMLLEFYRTRNAAKKGESFVWAPTGKPRHFEPSGFGRLKFAKEK